MRDILTIIRDAPRPAIVWNALLDAAYQAPATLGIAVRELLWAPGIIGKTDTRVAAGRLMSIVYPRLDEPDRRHIEEAVMKGFIASVLKFEKYVRGQK